MVLPLLLGWSLFTESGDGCLFKSGDILSSFWKLTNYLHATFCLHEVHCTSARSHFMNQQFGQMCCLSANKHIARISNYILHKYHYSPIVCLAKQQLKANQEQHKCKWITVYRVYCYEFHMKARNESIYNNNYNSVMITYSKHSDGSAVCDKAFKNNLCMDKQMYLLIGVTPII